MLEDSSAFDIRRVPPSLPMLRLHAPWVRCAVGRFGRRSFSLVKQGRWIQHRPLVLGGASATALGGYAAYRAYHLWTQEEEIELPPVPEPTPHFIHPYETWPWYQKAWFAFKRSASRLN